MELIMFLRELMRRRNVLPSQLAAKLGISHATVSRWLAGEDVPNIQSCVRLSIFSGIPLQHILYVAGHIETDMTENRDTLPAFREYVGAKYPGVFSDEVIFVLEGLINQKRKV